MRHNSWHAAGAGVVASLAALALTVLMVAAPSGVALAATKTWTIHPSPDITLPDHGTITSMSCPTADSCTAVGSYVNAAGITDTLAEAWNGTSWRKQKTANPAGDTAPTVDPALSGVSCIGPDDCEAVGNYTDVQTFAGLVFAEVWNGQSEQRSCCVPWNLRRSHVHHAVFRLVYVGDILRGCWLLDRRVRAGAACGGLEWRVLEYPVGPEPARGGDPKPVRRILCVRDVLRSGRRHPVVRSDVEWHSLDSASDAQLRGTGVMRLGDLLRGRGRYRCDRRRRVGRVVLDSGVDSCPGRRRLRESRCGVVLVR